MSDEPSLRKQVELRAGGRYEYCQLPGELTSKPFQVDHIIAEKHDGPTSLDNLAWTCLDCNSFKGPNLAGYDHDEKQTIRLFHPRLDEWSDHFEWEGPTLRAKTAIGKVTIAVLRINLDYRVAVRNSLIREEEFPPREA
jgi:hypothetical protein